MRISCFVTTAPRQAKIDYLAQTSFSLIDAGFNICLFAEPQSYIPPTVPYEQVIINEQLKGAWHNWKSAVIAMLSYSDDDFFLSCQDDIVIHPESKQLLKRFVAEYPTQFGYFSLYTPTHYTLTGGDIRPKKPGITVMGVPAAYGACCLLFPRKSLEALLTTKVWDSWLGVPTEFNPLEAFEDRKNNPWKIKHVDAAITRMLIELKLPLMYPIPSVCQHIGEHSSLGHAHCPVDLKGPTSRRIAQRIVDFTKPLIPQVFGE